MKRTDLMFFEIIGRAWALDAMGKFNIAEFNRMMHDVMATHLSEKKDNGKS